MKTHHLICRVCDNPFERSKPISKTVKYGRVCSTPCRRKLMRELLSTPEFQAKAQAKAVAARRARTHCRNGHEYNETNTYVRKNGTRKCRTCKNEAQRFAKQVQDEIARLRELGAA